MGAAPKHIQKSDSGAGHAIAPQIMLTPLKQRELDAEY